MAGGRFTMPLFTKELHLQDLGLFRDLHLYAFRTFDRILGRATTGDLRQ
jgi:hypothetical protein